MANAPFGLLLYDNDEIRRPSKLRLLLVVLVAILLILLIVFVMLYAVEKSQSDRSDSGTHAITANKTCTSASCVLSAADILNKLDESTNPCDDFYQYSCGGFIKKTNVPDGGNRYVVDAFSISADSIQYFLRETLQNENLMSNYTEGSAVHKAFTFYKSCMNESLIKNAGAQPIFDVIEQYGSWNITNEFWSGDSWILEKILARAMADLSTPAFLSLDVTPSYFNGNETVVTVSVGKSGYDDRFLTKEQSRARLSEKHWDFEKFEFDPYKEYRKFMSTIFTLLGSNSAIVDEEVNRIVKLEDEFKNIDVGWVDPTDIKKLRKNVTFMTVDELNNLTSFKFNWTLYFEEVLKGTDVSFSAESDKKLMVVLPDSIKKVMNWLTEKPKGILANEIMWNVVRGFIDVLPTAFGEARLKYKRRYDSSFQDKPRWKMCNSFTEKYFQHVTTLLYVNGYLPKGATEAASEMFKEIKGQFIDGLEEQHWMDDATREQARLKLKKMREWIAFPPFIKDPAKLNKFYEDIRLNETHLLQNMVNAYHVNLLKKLDELIKPSPSRFLFPPLTVNAFYNPLVNGMTILAGILQSPFYQWDRLQAINYGSLGMVVGHEITHGFDKQGSEYDENGNIREWWSKKSHENFVTRSTCLVEQYDKVKFFGYEVDGNKTLSENIADNGGLKYAFRAYNKWRAKHGNEAMLPALSFNNDQLFFIGFAQLWCAKYTKKGAKFRMDYDTHSVNPVRVRVPLLNFPEFSKAFGCTPPKKTCAVW